VRFDWVVVGAGLTGATFAERLAVELGQRVLVVDRRAHPAGNVYDYYDNLGILVHRYGAHIFHTKSRRVWEYLSQFTSWRPYEHRVLGSVDGQLVPIPFNLTTLRALVPRTEADRLECILIAETGAGNSISVLKLMEHRDSALRELGRLVYDKIFAGYSAKQWGMRLEDLDRSVSGRVPVVVSHDDRYFHDQFQGIPADGYTAMVHRMLDHPNIAVELEMDYLTARKRSGDPRILYTGPIDELFGYRFGPLPYRSLRFETNHYQQEFVQPVAVINFTMDHTYTRTLEHKHITGQRSNVTAVTTEWPEAHVAGENEPYYPVPATQSRAHYEAYRVLADAAYPDLMVAGRLADYRYYDMDQAVSRALVLFRERILSQRRRLRPEVKQPA
jgi:UDP-galactopyranose mutase